MASHLSLGTLRRVDTPYHHIACCVDRSEISESILGEAKRLRALGPGRLSIVHVSEWGILFGAYPGVAATDPEFIRQDSRRWLDAIVAANPGCEGVFLDGYPPAVVCEWAEGAGVDLLVASSSRGLVARVLLGSFAGYLARHAPCAVLLTRAGVAHEPGQAGSDVREE
jgi:nucleotide-binding universal stress UspA family protein